MSNLPTIIQGGIGAAVSNWRLAKAVSRLGQLGVVSGTALDFLLGPQPQSAAADLRLVGRVCDPGEATDGCR